MEEDEIIAKKLNFRVWDKVNKKMYYSVIYLFNGGLDGVEVKDPNNKDNIILYKDYALMQGTNFKDIHGKKIYEGDIERSLGILIYFPTNSGPPFNFQPFWKKKNIKTKEEREDFNDYSIKSPASFFNQVIGNVYENPEFVYENPELKPMLIH